jgi:hypothetical protein
MDSQQPKKVLSRVALSIVNKCGYGLKVSAADYLVKAAECDTLEQFIQLTDGFMYKENLSDLNGWLWQFVLFKISIEKIEYLLQLGTNPNHNMQNTTTIMERILYYYKLDENVLDFIKLFVKYGGDPKIEDSYGKTLLERAQEYKIQNVVDYLLFSDIEKL